MRQRQSLAPALIVAMLPALSFAVKPPSDKVTYQYSRHGDPDIVVTPSPLVVLSGGASDVPDAFKRMCVANNGGDFLVLGTSTFNKNYFSYIRNACIDAGKPANSVAVLIVPDAAAANQQFVYDTIVQAETVWIAGGDQGDYISFWSGRKLQQALNARIAQGVVLGGISAGLNVLTEFVFSAQGTTTVTSSFALANPDSPSITLVRGFVTLNALTGLIGDPHFAARDRMGRDLAFLSRIYNSPWTTLARGVSVDEATAVLISGSGSTWSADVIGAGNAYFLQPVAPPSPIVPGAALTGIRVNVFRIGPGGTFAISGNPWTGSSYDVWADTGVLKSTQPGNAIY